MVAEVARLRIIRKLLARPPEVARLRLRVQGNRIVWL